MVRLKRLAIISTMESYPWGGSEELWYETAREAQAKNIEVSISYRNWAQTPKKLIDLKNDGAKILLRKYEKSYPSISDRIKSRLFKKPISIESPNEFEQIFNDKPNHILVSEGGFGNIVRFNDLCLLLANCDIKYSIIVEQNKEFGTVGSGYLKVARSIYKNASNVFFVSQRNLEIAELMLCTDLPNAKVVRNPVNLKKPLKIAWPTIEKPKFACIGRIYCEAKGQDLLLRALAHVKKDWDIELTFYGQGKDEAYLKELAVYLDLENNVEFAGFENSIEKIWKTNHMLVLASHYEGIPLVVVEAMLCGRPSLVTDVAGNSEWIKNGENGFISKSTTVHDLTSTIINALQNQHKWEQMGKNAHDTAMNLYDKNPGKTILTSITNDLDQ